MYGKHVAIFSHLGPYAWRLNQAALFNLLGLSLYTEKLRNDNLFVRHE